MQTHPSYPPRAPLDDAACPDHTDASVLDASWADPPRLTPEALAARQTYFSGPLGVPGDELRSLADAGIEIRDGRPVNPTGPTGLDGRGLLGRWGPNHAADPIVLRKRSPEGYQVLVVHRTVDKKWSLPGGFVDAGETATQALRKELGEEAVENSAESIEAFMRGGKVVYRGYVDDPRTTNNAWIETVAMAQVVDDSSAIRLRAEDAEKDEKGVPLVSGAKWLDADASNEEFAGLYGDHKRLVMLAIEAFAPSPGPPPRRPVRWAAFAALAMAAILVVW